MSEPSAHQRPSGSRSGLSTPSATRPLGKVASSECSRDQPFIVFEEQLENEAECTQMCENYASVSALGCSFAAWTQGPILGKCILYNEDFADYLANCQLLSGPPDVSGCPVDHPTEGSCEVVRCQLVFDTAPVFHPYLSWMDIIFAILQRGRVRSAWPCPGDYRISRKTYFTFYWIL